ncbi:MAG: type VI secretion system protein TssA [Rhodospirillales bacterium]|nr:type VI secretion system protein TssA [Rhodospirillales bacterium]
MPRLDDPRIAAALAPLPADAPDPAAFRYDPEFEALEGEIARLERDGPAAIRWAEVARGAQAVLAGRSKDLSAASWLAVALGETEGLAGLATGLAILRDLVEQQWAMLFPQRPRARAGAFAWLAARAVHAVPQDLADAAAGPAALAAFEEIEALDRLLGEKLADAPSLGELLRPLRALAQEYRRAEVAAQSEAQANARAMTAGEGAAIAAAATEAAGSPPAAVTAARAVALPALPTIGGDDAEALFASLREAVRTAALGVLEADPGEARAYQMLRAVTWLGITELPPLSNGRTALLAPPETRRSEFDALTRAGNSVDLVRAVESFCSGSGMFWLDGQRISATALAGMGPRFAACSAVVVQGVQAVLRRLPGLEALCFADGTPFADPATRSWIDAIVLGEGAGAAEDGEGGAPWQQALGDARIQAGNGEIEAALAALAAGAAAAPDRRSAFLWRLNAATLCLESGLAAIAVPVLRDLDRLIDVHGLEVWEPEVAARATMMLHRSLQAAPADDSAVAEENAVLARAAFARLARLDPVAAARLAGGVRAGGMNE